MEWMDKARRNAGLAWVSAGLLLAVWQVGSTHEAPGVVTVAIALLVVALATLVVAGAADRWRRGTARAVGVVLGLDFAGAVADRFGLLGDPGSPGVSWGSWARFTDYTQTLLHGVDRPLAMAAAVAATLAEVALAALLLVGWQRRWVGKATAGLLTVYLVGMATSVGMLEVAQYAVPILIGGALLMSAVPAATQGERSPLGGPSTALAPKAVNLEQATTDAGTRP